MRFTDGLDDPFVPGAKWTGCPCREYDDAVLPAAGEPLVFGTHKQRDVDAETAPAWPSLPAHASSLNRRLRGSR
jgi:hypothetical protein